MSITYAALASGSATSGGGENVLSLMKMLKLARLGRIIRLLKFKIFQELKLMIQGVFTGLRVLFWAVVLLISCVYLLGVFTRTIYEEDVKEFATVPDAMLTWFRCFTDGCTTFQGAPLQDCGLSFLLNLKVKQCARLHFGDRKTCLAGGAVQIGQGPPGRGHDVLYSSISICHYWHLQPHYGA